jgi:hypothetical protein
MSRPAEAPAPTPSPADALETFIAQPERADEFRLRLGITVALAIAGLLLFRGAAIPALVGALLGCALALGALNLGFHNLGIRWLGRIWPGTARAATTALLVFCLCPPSTPPWVAGGAAALGVLIEGRLRKVALPLATGGAILVWPLVWAWQVHAGLGYVRPFDLRPLDEPIRLWTQSQIALDPVRLYTGNVPGPLGVTSFGLVALGVLLLAYARRASWGWLVGAAVPLAVGLLAARQPLTVHLLSGPALAFGGLVGADSRRLPKAPAWRVGAGAGTGVVAFLLLRSGMGVAAFGLAVLVVGLLVALFQIYGLAGSPAVVPTAAAAAPEPAWGPALTAQALALVVFLPLGLFLLWRDAGLTRSARVSLATVGIGLYAVAAALAMTWLNYLRLPG